MSRDAFESWFAHNHPWDWWAKEMGAPIPTRARWLVSEFARRAYQEGRRDGIEEAAWACDSAASEWQAAAPEDTVSIWGSQRCARLVRALLSTPGEPSK